MMAPHHARKSAAFADADDVDEFLAFEDIDQNPVAGLDRCRASSACFVSTSIGTSRMKLHRRQIVLAKMSAHRLGQPRFSFTNSTRPICAASYPSRVAVLCCVTTHGPACSTVAGRTSPFASNSCVMPTFLPRIPATFAISYSFSAMLGSAHGLAARYYLCSLPNALISTSTPAGRSSFISASTVCWRRLENIEQPLVRADLELLRATSCPRAGNAARNTCSSSWAMESAPRSARRCASPFPQSRPSTGPGCGSRRLSAGCEFFLFQSRFLSDPSRLLRKERTRGKLQAALAKCQN